MKKSMIIVIVIVVLAIGTVAAFALVNKEDKAANTATTGATENTSGNSTSDSNSQTSDATPSESTTQTAIITFDGSEFTPETLTVKTGTTVTVKNTSSKTIQFDSDPHPAHTDNKDLNAGTVTAGQSITFVAVNKGTFGYHDHLNPSETGTIIVE